MKKSALYLIILFIALTSVVQGMVPSDQPDVVYVGTSKNYYVLDTPDSKYIWKVNEESEESTSHSINIKWALPGAYTLSVQEITKNNCVGPVQSLKVTVLPLPTATISGTVITCPNEASPLITFTGSGGTAPYTFTYNINNGTNKTVTTNTGDTVTVRVSTSVSGTLVYNLVELTDSKGITNKQAGTATVTVNAPTYAPPVTRVVCPLQIPFKWNGLECPGPETYHAVVGKDSHGCDSIATLELRVESPLVSRTKAIVCQSDLPFIWNNQRCMTSDTYFANNLKTAAGCDSVAILDLTVNTPTNMMKTVTVCEGETYQFGGQSYAAPHVYDVPLKDIHGCDSVVLRLEVQEMKGSYTEQSVRIFEGDTYAVNGHMYNTPGKYTDVVKVSGACDDVIVTDLSFINIPNTLTPNGRTANQLFMPGYRIQVYNRNGIKLYEGTDGWDGTYKGSPVAKDTYFYVLYYESESKIKSKEGYVTVLR